VTATRIDLHNFSLPEELAASAPPPRRDQVRLLVARADGITHTRFARMGEFLEPGDLVVVNTSTTLAAAVDGVRSGGRGVTVHFASALDDGSWVVEVRPRTNATGPVEDLERGERIALPDCVALTVDRAHPGGQSRLWQARVAVDADVVAYLDRVGRPIRYGYINEPVPIAHYQTVFARDGGGSAEMPSAAHPFSTELVTDLVSRGVMIAPIVLHTGVSSQEVGEPPQPERFRVPETTARLVNMTREGGHRVVAVGTTVTRALESALDRHGRVCTRWAWTDLVLGPRRPACIVNALVTGWHAPGASHLQLLQAVAGRDLVERAYAAALRERYLWHEFGDSCLLLP
jgi:S-adenosylmethionine:tRNA ribosyltransferase-isomerase